MNQESTNAVNSDQEATHIPSAPFSSEINQPDQDHSDFSPAEFESINSAIESGDSANVNKLSLQMMKLVNYFKFALKEKHLCTPTKLIKLLLNNTIPITNPTQEFFETTSKILSMMKQTSECKAILELMKSLSISSDKTLKHYFDCLIKDGRFDEAEANFEEEIQKLDSTSKTVSTLS